MTRIPAFAKGRPARGPAFDRFSSLLARLGRVAAVLWLVVAATGCGDHGGSAPSGGVGRGGAGPAAARRAPPGPLPNRIAMKRRSAAAPLERADRAASSDSGPPTGAEPSPHRSTPPAPPGQAGPETPSPHPWNDSTAAAEGLRKLTGKHLILYTDLPSRPEVDQLPALFDQAEPQWCDYFQTPRAKADGWRMIGCLMRDEERFRRAGLVPKDLPPFLHGYQRGDQLWLREQPSDYYRRHLLLHEGTHAFMSHLLGGMGPPWYKEGIAELLATHRMHEGRVELRYFPRSREETPMWGRIKIIQDEMAAGRFKPLEAVMAYRPADFLKDTAYGWCWAAAALLDNLPRTQGPFRELRRDVRDRSDTFSRRFRERLAADWPDLARQWQLFALQIDYGYDVAREAIQSRPSRPLGPEGRTVEIAADRGWQSTGIWLPAGFGCRLTASGRFQIARRGGIWWSEAGGVTIRYYRGRPIGLLLGAVCDDRRPPQGLTPLAHPTPIGVEGVLEASSAGALYLRINDFPAELADNAGRLTVRIAPN